MSDEREVDEHLHIRVGERYRITERWAAMLAAGHLTPEYVDARRRGGVVERITVSDRWGWDSVRIRLDQPPAYDDGSTGGDIETASAADLEPIAEPRATHLETDR